MKRKRNPHVGGTPRKKPRNASSQSAPATPSTVDHPVLRQFYPEVLSLRQYLLAHLPGSSKNRRRRISQLGLNTAAQDSELSGGLSELDIELGRLLDSTLVGVLPKTNQLAPSDTESRTRDIVSFSQQLPECASGSTLKSGSFLQSEIVNFVIWLLFKRSSSFRPSPHLLCYGFKRGNNHSEHVRGQCATQCIPGITAQQPNFYVQTLKGPLWSRLHSLLGIGGDRIIMDLLIDCAIFSRIDNSSGNYYQLSGPPLSVTMPDTRTNATSTNASADQVRKPGAISFLRSRMLYARAALNAKGGVRFGMRHIHVLNRFPDRNDQEQTVHIMRYLFPRQFGLHNAFTSNVDSRESSMPFKDYTIREEEIKQAMERAIADKRDTEHQAKSWKTNIPKRLRGEARSLVEKMRKLHYRCSYMELLRHYCPVEGVHISAKPDWRKNPLQPNVEAGNADSAQTDKGNEGYKINTRTVQQTCFTDMACPTAHVSAFCRAVIAKVVPNGFWGGDHNKRIIMYWIDQFVCLRRSDTLTLHQVTQKLQISNLAWLRLPGQDPNVKMAKTDADKRHEIFLELVYWLFDSFLIPLIRTNFHVTESNVHKKRLFYFRHDVWRMLTEPAISKLRLDMFEEMPTGCNPQSLPVRALGYSKIRLLPKATGARPLMNLKRKQQTMRNGSIILGQSINSALSPLYTILTYEKTRQPEKFGSSLFSVMDILPKLITFRNALQEQGLADRPLYFAKADVQSCFDTIPQKRLLSMVESLMSTDVYHLAKRVEVKPAEQLQKLEGEHVDSFPVRKYKWHGESAAKLAPFDRTVRDRFVGMKANTVFSDTTAQRFEARDDLMQLLREHVERNVVRIGKKFYRQKTGIPQGSVLSSILCNYFYADFERTCLGFLSGPNSLLLRLLDDFCLITTNLEHAERFMKTIHRGNADYGITVKPAKSLANFDVVTDSGYRIPRVGSEDCFPYCGVLIDMRSLEVSKNGARGGQARMADSLTVELHKMPGQTFHRKALNAFKIQLKAMFIDTSLNTVPTVLENLYASFYEAAVRLFEYDRSLRKVRPTQSQLLIKTVEGIIGLACVLLQRRTRSKASQNVERVRSVISRKQIQWLACKAFNAVFQRRQTQHRVLLAWLGHSLATIRPHDSWERWALQNAIAGHAGRLSAGQQ